MLGKEQSLRGASYAGYWRGLITTSFSTQEIVSPPVFLVMTIYQRKSLPEGSGCSSVWVHTMNYTERDCYKYYTERDHCNRRSYFPRAVRGETEPDEAKEDTGCLQRTSPILSGSKKQGGPMELVQGDTSMKGKI